MLSSMKSRHYSSLDTLIGQVDSALRTLFGTPVTTERPNPAANTAEADLSESARNEAARLMRINHTGEVCAQALYQGQALTAKLDNVRERMERAAQEENDHLDWCEKRVHELGSHTSVLNPAFYAGSFAIGAIAGVIGDKWSLGFVAETEKQVIKHLDEHLEQIDPHDEKSRVILEQMKVDEAHHGNMALDAGGAPLPRPVQKAMQLTSKIMTKSVYWI